MYVLPFECLTVSRLQDEVVANCSYVNVVRVTMFWRIYADVGFLAWHSGPGICLDIDVGRRFTSSSISLVYIEFCL